ncbi:MAG: pyridine nucleotide-disulfide oxidoreductase [Rhodanobacter sp.]|nr:MAG: pyridine nucleotide-disulfide oxidoreductase [Rhodanobacter sp.]
MFRRIAIIGGGAAGATLLSELIGRRTAQPLHLDWYTGPGTPGRGVAYATRSEQHLLNVRAASMGMFAHRPGGFLEYARRNDPTIAATDFLPRRLYGDYLEEETAHALALAKAHGHDVHVVPFAVDAMVPEHDGVNVLHGDVETRVDAAVLALGALPPQPHPAVSQAALASGRYIVEPWPFLARSADVPPPRRVALIGLGLTTVDLLLELSARWPDTEFVAISRHGQLPGTHGEQIGLPPEDGDVLLAAMRDAPTVRTWMHLLREACSHDDDWRSVIDGLRPHLSTLWADLSDDERGRFLRHARGTWERARHRMPPQVAARVATLERDGRLRRMRGRTRNVEASVDDELRLDMERAGQPIAPLHAELVIQATGLDTDVRHTPHGLVRQLVTNGHILPDPFGLGCIASPDGRVHHADGPWSRLFALGALLRGTLWESTAMPEIRQHARQLADRLLAP